MTEELFDLVFDGRLATGFAPERVRQNMAELFNLGEAQLEALFSGRVVVLKRGLDKGQAIRFRNRLAQAGALGLIRPQQVADAVAPAKAAPASAAAPAARPAAAPRPAPVAAPAPAPAVAAAAAVVAGELLTCPRCGHEQAQSDSCGACRMDLRLHLQRLEKRARVVAAARRS